MFLNYVTHWQVTVNPGSRCKSLISPITLLDVTSDTWGHTFKQITAESQGEFWECIESEVS